MFLMTGKGDFDIHNVHSCHVETIDLLRREKVDSHVEMDLDVDKSGRKSGSATFAEIKAYNEEK